MRKRVSYFISFKQLISHQMKKENKSITVGKNTMTVNYHDTNKHFTYFLDKDHPTRELTLFNKKLKGFKLEETKPDFLSPEQREIFNDLVYARHTMSWYEINKLPLTKRYRVKTVSRKVEKLLNNWKKEIVAKKVDELLLKLFPHSQLVKQMVTIPYEDVSDLYNDNISVHSVFSEEEIAQYLYEKGLFPKIK